MSGRVNTSLLQVYIEMKHRPGNSFSAFLDPEGGSQKATPVVLLVVISSLKILKAFLIRSGAR